MPLGGVTHDHDVPTINSDGGRCDNHVSRIGATVLAGKCRKRIVFDGPPLTHHPARQVKDLHPRRECVCDIHIAVAVNRQSARPKHLAGPDSGCAERPHELPRRRHHLHTPIREVGHHKIGVTVGRDGAGVVELAGADTWAAEVAEFARVVTVLDDDHVDTSATVVREEEFRPTR